MPDHEVSAQLRRYQHHDKPTNTSEGPGDHARSDTDAVIVPLAALMDQRGAGGLVGGRVSLTWAVATFLSFQSRGPRFPELDRCRHDGWTGGACQRGRTFIQPCPSDGRPLSSSEHICATCGPEIHTFGITAKLSISGFQPFLGVRPLDSGVTFGEDFHVDFLFGYEVCDDRLHSRSMVSTCPATS